MSKFNIYAEKIIRVLGRTNRWLTINEISKRADISWMTTRKHLESLEKMGIVKKSKRTLKSYWQLNFKGKF